MSAFSTVAKFFGVAAQATTPATRPVLRAATEVSGAMRATAPLASLTARRESGVIVQAVAAPTLREVMPAGRFRSTLRHF